MTTHEGIALPGYADIEAAAARIRAGVVRTPLLESPRLSAETGMRILVKPEGLQPTGSFKIRGAMNRVAALTEEEKVRGIVARSSGNHGQALALAGAAAGVSVVVVVPASAPAIKVQMIRDLGARVVQVPKAELTRAALRIQEEENRIFVPPADDFHVVAGAGTVAREIFEQAAEIGLQVDTLMASCSGGGLTAGSLLSRDALSPATEIVAVEAEGFEKMANSLRAGRQVDLEPGGQSICDAINGLFTARIPFGILRDADIGLTSVSDLGAMEAMRIAAQDFGLIVEPGAAVGLAAALRASAVHEGKCVVVILSGRNVDPEILRDAMVATPRTTE